MPSIGGVTVIRLVRDPDPPGEQTQLLQRPGVDGMGARKLGTRGRAYRITTLVDATDANRAAKIASLKALQGTIVTVVDGAGDTFTQVLVQRVVHNVKAILTPAGGVEGASGTWMVTGNFDCVDVGTS